MKIISSLIIFLTPMIILTKIIYIGISGDNSNNKYVTTIKKIETLT